MTLVRVRKGPPGSAVATGVVVAPTVVITAGHVLTPDGEIAVSDSETPACVVFDGRAHDPSRDIAVLETSKPLVEAASPMMFFGTRRRDASLVASGFWKEPDQLTPRATRVDRVEEAGVGGLVQFTTAEGDPTLMVGMSGGCIRLESGTHPAPVVGILVDREHAQQVHRGGWFLPIDELAQIYPPFLKYVAREWEFGEDWTLYWSPRARGRLPRDKRGWFYVPNTDALSRIGDWWRSAETDRNLMLIIGEPGSGKSSLAAQLVAQSSPRFRAEASEAGALPFFDPDDGPDVVLHLRNKTPAEVAYELDQQLPANRPTARPLRVVVDALDEAQDPAGVADMLSERLLRQQARVLAAQLPSAAAFWRDRSRVNELDLSDYVSEEDVQSAVARRLDSRGLPPEDRDSLARDITEAAAGNFLVASLFADAISTADPAEVGVLLASAAEAMVDAVRAYVRAKFVDPLSWSRAEPVLTGLALSRELALPIGEVWEALASACADQLLDEPLTKSDIRRALQSSRDFLVVSPRGEWSFFHNAFAVALRGDAETQAARERQIADAFIARTSNDWRSAPEYALHHLASHAAMGGCLEVLLNDLAFVEQADGNELANACYRYAGRIDVATRERRAAVQQAVRGTQPGRSRATQLAWAAAVQRDAALLEEIAKREDKPYVIPRGVVTLRFPDVDRTIADLGGFLSVVLTEDAARTIWAISADGELYVWDWGGDPADAEGDAAGALKLVRFPSSEGTTIVALRANGELFGWRADDGTVAALRVDKAHPGWILDAALLPTADGEQLLTAGADGALRSWTPDGQPGRLVVERAHNASIRGVCVVPFGDDYRVATAGGDLRLRSWRRDRRLGELDERDIHETWVWGLVAVTTANHPPFLVTVSEDRTIRSWFPDGTRGPLEVRNAHDGRIQCVAAVPDDDEAVVVTGGTDGALRFWSAEGDLVEDIPAAHDGAIRAIAPHPQGLVSAGADGRVIAWSTRGGRRDGSVGRARRTIGSASVVERAVRNAHAGVVSALLGLDGAGGGLVVSAGGDRMVRLWRANEAERGEIAALQAPALVRHLVALDESRIVMLGVDGSVALLAIERPVAGETPACDTGDWTMSFADPLAMGMSHEFLDEVRSAGVGSLGAVRTNADARHIIADLPSIVTVDGGNVALWFASGRRLDLGQLPAASGRVALEVVNVAPEPIVVVAFDDGRIETWLPNGEKGPLSQRAHRGAVRDLTTLWLNGSAALISVGDDSYVCSWDLISGELRYKFKTYEAGASVATLSSDGFAFGHVAGGIVFATDAVV